MQKDGQGRVVASAPATGGILNGHPISDSTLHKLLTKYGLD